MIFREINEYYDFYLSISQYLFFTPTGGMVSKPLEKAENDKIQEIGNKFYNTCEANEQSGKTLWIGIERSKENKWVVRFLFISYFH